MNKTLITLGFLVLILGAIVGDIVLAIFRPEQLGTFNGAIVTILGVGTAAVVTFYGLGTQGEKLKKIEAQTNGNMTRVQEENERLTNVIIEAGIDTGAIPSESPPRGDHVA